MTTSDRIFLQVQLIETKRLRELAGDHPIMSVALAEREEELLELIAALPPPDELGHVSELVGGPKVRDATAQGKRSAALGFKPHMTKP